MSDSTALAQVAPQGAQIFAHAPSSELDLQGMMTLAQSMAASGFFANAKDANKALSVMMIGREMGIGPAASLNGINVINGKPQLGATLIAAQVKKAGYDYRILEHTAEVCRIEFFSRRGESLGESSFSAQDAKTAGYLKNPQYAANPRNMLFARAMSNGAKWFAPDAFNGQTVYHEGEIEIAQAALATPKVSPQRPAASAEVPTAPDDSDEPNWTRLARAISGPESDAAVAFGRSIGLDRPKLDALKKACTENDGVDWRYVLLEARRRGLDTVEKAIDLTDPFSDANAVETTGEDVSLDEVEGGTDRGR